MITCYLCSCYYVCCLAKFLLLLLLWNFCFLYNCIVYFVSTSAVYFDVLAGVIINDEYEYYHCYNFIHVSDRPILNLEYT